MQHVAPSLDLEPLLIELQYHPATEREAAACRLAACETQHSFDLSRGPIIRARLFRLQTTDHLLLLVVHHTAFDA